MTLTTLRRVAQIFVFLRHDCAKLKRINKQTMYEKKNDKTIIKKQSKKEFNRQLLRLTLGLYEWQASNFSLQYHSWSTRQSHENKRNDHQLMKILRAKQILFDCLHLRKRIKKSMENLQTYLKVFKGLIDQSVSQLINPSILWINDWLINKPAIQFNLIIVITRITGVDNRENTDRKVWNVTIWCHFQMFLVRRKNRQSSRY